MILSICIPTYNRGNSALHLVKELCEQLYDIKEEIEIIVSNNGSTKYVEEYNEIEKLAEKVKFLTYHRFEENKQYVGNYNYVVSASQGDFCMLVSDEDTINKEVLVRYIELLKNNPQIGLFRPGTTYFYPIATKQYCSAGLEAIRYGFCMNTYVSGATYNRRILIDEVFEQLVKAYDPTKNEAYYYYPHLFVEGLLQLYSDYFIWDEILIEEGKDTGDQKVDTNIPIVCYGTKESRLAQFAGFLQFIGDVEANDGIKLKMIMNLLERMACFISCCGLQYEERGMEWSELVNYFFMEIQRILGDSNIPVVQDYLEDILLLAQEMSKELLEIYN